MFSRVATHSYFWKSVLIHSKCRKILFLKGDLQMHKNVVKALQLYFAISKKHLVLRLLQPTNQKSSRIEVFSTGHLSKSQCRELCILWTVSVVLANKKKKKKDSRKTVSLPSTLPLLAFNEKWISPNGSWKIESGSCEEGGKGKGSLIEGKCREKDNKHLGDRPA